MATQQLPPPNVQTRDDRPLASSTASYVHELWKMTPCDSSVFPAVIVEQWGVWELGDREWTQLVGTRIPKGWEYPKHTMVY